jgi:hypothetical protein
MSFRRKGSGGSSNAYEGKLMRGRSGSACSGGSGAKDDEPFKLVLVNLSFIVHNYIIFVTLG